MARLSISHRPTGPVASQTDQLNAELGQLLNRLQHAILYVDPKTERRLRTSEIERTKTNKNIAYARSVLTKLEQESLGLKAHILRQDFQADLNQKREVLDVLIDRMQDLEQMAIHHDDDDDDDDSDSDGEDVLAGIIPTPSESMDSGSVDHGQEQQTPDESDTPSPPPPEPEARPSAPSPTPQPPSWTSHEPPASTPAPTSQATTTAPPSTTAAPTHPTSTDQNLRPRRTQNPDSHTTARATLLGPRRRTATSTTSSSTHKDSEKHSTLTAEALLDRQRTEQEALVTGILTYASALKSSSQRFHDALERDKEALGRAAEGMDRTETGMQAAKRRVDVLTRMTEGKGWWGRVLLFAWVYGLMVVLILVVFVLPKLRF